jgi:hypothetical protein
VDDGLHGWFGTVCSTLGFLAGTPPHRRPSRGTLLRAFGAAWLALVGLTAIVFGALSPGDLLFVLVTGTIGLPAGVLYLTGLETRAVVPLMAWYWGVLLALHAACVAFRRWWIFAVVVVLVMASFGGCVVAMQPLMHMSSPFK